MRTCVPTTAADRAARRAFLRDTARFIQALGHQGAADERMLRGLERWLTAATDAIRQHLTLEREAFGVLAPGRHALLETALSEVTTAVRELTVAPVGERDTARRDAEKAAVRLRAALLEHLDEEASEQNACFADSVGCERDAGHGGWRRDPLATRYGTFGLCWCLDAATPQEYDDIWGALPRSVRARYRLVLRQRYRQLAAVLEPTAARRPAQRHHDTTRRHPMTRTVSTTATGETTTDPQTVWELISDLQRYAEWVHGTLAVIDGDPIARPGAVYREKNRVVGPITARSTWQVTEVDVDRGYQRHESHGAPGIPTMAVLMWVTPTASGTHVRLTLEAEIAAGPATGPLARFMERTLSAGNETTMRALVGLVEREAALPDAPMV